MRFDSNSLFIIANVAKVLKSKEAVGKLLLKINLSDLVKNEKLVLRLSEESLLKCEWLSSESQYVSRMNHRVFSLIYKTVKENLKY